MSFSRMHRISGMTAFALVAMCGPLRVAHATPASGILGGSPPDRASGYLEKILATVRAYPPDSLSLDTSDCLSKPAKRQLESFDWVFRSGAFKKAYCLRQVHAYRTKPNPAINTSVYIMSFHPKDLDRAVGILKKEKSPVIPRIAASEFYKWHVVDGRLVLLVLDGGPPYDLFNQLDTMTVDYLKPATKSREISHE